MTHSYNALLFNTVFVLKYLSKIEDDINLSAAMFSGTLYIIFFVWLSVCF